MWTGLKWRAPGGDNDSSHPNDFDPSSSDIRNIRPEGDVVVTEPTSILGGTGLVRWIYSALRRGNTYWVSEVLDQTQEGHGGGGLLGFSGIDAMVKRWLIQSQP